jgi:glycerol-3-phosphate responsive antiterminator
MKSPFNTALSTLTITSFSGKLYENAAKIQIDVVAGGLFNSQTDVVAGGLFNSQTLR